MKDLTEKLYYQNGHLARFTARVLSCARDEKGWAVKLDRTAFFPGGGGQEADEGELSGLNLLGLREEGEDVVHLVPEPLEPGALVEGKLNWPLRFARMQGHSGEHILSGTVHRLFGCDNVGFHMGAEDITIDFNAELSREDLARAELETNRAVWRNVPVRTLLPSPGELAEMEYRSKKELSGEVRIVEIEGVDRCACCAPHVGNTGEVGVVKIIDSMRHRGGTRLSILCGEAVKRLEVQAAEMDVTVKIEGAAECNADENDMYTMISNVLSNAIKYNKRGGSVTIRLTPEGDGAKLEVEDTGIGIAPEHVGRIFERFFKVDTARTRSKALSTGLGLSIVKQLADRYGAKIDVKSEVGKGTCVTLTFGR